MTRFRKKPVVIEATLFDNPKTPSPDWLADAINRGDVWYQGGERPYLTIKTLEGEMRASIGDWIIKGVKGEIYPCKPDIFAATYEPAEGAAEGETPTPTWRKPPPHFKPDPLWQRQPQSNDEWDAQNDEPGKREFRAKRRLAFAGDLADPRAPECLDVSVVLSRLTWLEARFENTRESALPPASPSKPSAPDGVTPSREQIAQAVYGCIFGGTSDPTLDENAQGLALNIADAILAITPQPPGPGAWRGIDDQARNGEDYLFCRAGTKLYRVLSHAGNFAAEPDYPWMSSDDGPDIHRDWPTHYMPLPAPPSASGEATMGEENV